MGKIGSIIAIIAATTVINFLYPGIEFFTIMGAIILGTKIIFA